MDIYLTSGGERLRIPLNPDRLSIKQGTTSISFQIIQLGEHKIPRGTSLTGYSWNGVFPGESMAGMSFIHDWQPPIRIIETLNRWMSSNAIIQLLVTETAINDNVFIDSFVYDHYGVDNVSYTLTLTAYRPLHISTAPPQPEVIIPVEEVTTKTESTKPSSGSSNPGAKAPTKSNTTTITSKKKLSVVIPQKSLVSAAKNAATKAVTVSSTLSAARNLGTVASAALKNIAMTTLD